MIETKNGRIYEPTVDLTQSIYTWLRKYRDTLEGSRAYEDIKDIYEAFEFDYGRTGTQTDDEL